MLLNFFVVSFLIVDHPAQENPNKSKLFAYVIAKRENLSNQQKERGEKTRAVIIKME